jgi:hypothetical protein
VLVRAGMVLLHHVCTSTTVGGAPASLQTPDIHHLAFASLVHLLPLLATPIEAPSFVAAHQDAPTCMELSKSMMTDEGEYKVRSCALCPVPTDAAKLGVSRLQGWIDGGLWVCGAGVQPLIRWFETRR